jgi:PAS domain S-box-containing protein
MAEADEPSIEGLDAAELAAAFPFSFGLNEQLRLCHAGPSLRKLCPDLKLGMRFEGLFRVVRPQLEPTYELLSLHSMELFAIALIGCDALLRGQFLVRQSGRTLLFLGSPWLIDALDLERLNLGLSDFAVHDPAIDLLHLMQAERTAYADVRQLADKLAAERARLRELNGQLSSQNTVLQETARVLAVKRAEASRLALVAARTDNGVVLTDTEGRIEWVNDGFSRITGYQLDEVKGRRPGSMLQGPASDPATVARISAALRRGEGFHEIIVNYTREGASYWVDIACQPLRDDAGVLTGFMAIESDITSRVQLEQTLLQQQQRMDLATNAARAGVWDWEIGPDVLHWDAMMFELYGYEAGSGPVTFETWRRRVHEADLANVERQLAASIESGTAFRTEYRIHRQGEIRWISADAIVMRRDDGSPLRVVGINTDITARKEAARREHELYKLLSQIASQVPGMVYQFKLHPDGRTSFPYASEGIRSIYGVSPAQVATDATAAFNAIHPDDVERVRESIIASARTLKPWECVHRVQRSGELVRWLKGSSTPQPEADGSVLWHGYISDVTSEVLREQHLHENEQRLRLALSAAGFGMWDWNIPAGTMIVNDTWYTLLGYEPGAKMVDIAYCESLCHPDDAANANEMLTRHWQGEAERYVSEQRFRTASGEWKWMLDIGEVVERDEMGRPVRMLGVYMDIDARKRMVEELEAAREQAESANRLKSGFLTSMSHELRTPLAAIMGYAGLLCRSDALAVQEATWAGSIRRNADHLLALLDDVLDLSRIEAGQFTLAREPADPRVIVQAVVAVMGPLAAEKCIGLEVRFEPGTPAAILTDPLRVRQILINLVGNAIKYTDQGCVTIHLGTEHAAEGAMLRVDVRDTGIGLSAQQRALLYRPFSQAHDAESVKRGGVGMGLNISQRLAGMLGGRIECESTPGAGSTFTLRLPLTLANAGSPPLPSSSSRANDQAPDRPIEGLRLLVAEDSPDLQRLLVYMLGDAGALVTCTANGQEALKAAQAVDRTDQAFDLILMDMQMPVMNGYDATRAMRSCGITTPIIALTAHAMSGDRDRCMEAGCNEYLTKPVDEPLLMRTIRRLRPDALPGTPPAGSHAGTTPNAPAVPTTTAPPSRPWLAHLREEFNRTLPERADAIAAAFDSDGPRGKECAALVHQMAGIASNLGRPDITQLAITAEESLRTHGAAAAAASHVAALVAAMRHR